MNVKGIGSIRGGESESGSSLCVPQSVPSPLIKLTCSSGNLGALLQSQILSIL